MKNTGESRRLLDSTGDSSREDSPEVVLNCLEITVQWKGLGIHNLLVNPILIIKAVKSLKHHASSMLFLTLYNVVVQNQMVQWFKSFHKALASDQQQFLFPVSLALSYKSFQLEKPTPLKAECRQRRWSWATAVARESLFLKRAGGRLH